MRWDQVQSFFPSQWLIIEATKAETIGNKRVVSEIAVIDVFQDNSKKALLDYVKLHRLYPQKEYYVVHTSRPELDIEEQAWTGVRV